MLLPSVIWESSPPAVRRNGYAVGRIGGTDDPGDLIVREDLGVSVDRPLLGINFVDDKRDDFFSENAAGRVDLLYGDLNPFC
jgi:hypothetical protein